MIAPHQKIAFGALSLAAVFGLLAVLYTTTMLRPELPLRHALREVVLGAEKKESVESLRGIAIKGLATADRFQRAYENERVWAERFFLTCLGIETLALALIALRKGRANLEGCVRPERSGAVNTTIVEQAPASPEVPQGRPD